MKFRQASILALSPELASIPRRSPQTSIILAEVARRQREATEQRRRTGPLQAFFARLLANRRLEKPIVNANVSVALTVNGPLVYQW
jgi:hypothetical protein